MRIIVVEDNLSVAQGLRYFLEDAGHAVDQYHDGAEALEVLKEDAADLVVLDINLPGRSGLEVLRDMRGRNDLRPVLLLTAQSELHDKVRGLDVGADDYLCKPFEMEEFGARIRALARRVDHQPDLSARLGQISFDRTSRTVIGPNGPLEIPRREIALFERLFLAGGRLVSKQTLLDSLYGTGTDVDEPVVEVYVSRLRKRLQPFGVSIITKRGLGYKLETAS